MHDQLKPIDSKNLARLEKLRDMVLYRYVTKDSKTVVVLGRICTVLFKVSFDPFSYSGTGVQEAVNRAVELSQVVPAYMVHNVHSFYSET